MERFIKGDVVVIPFPFSDLTGTKRIPALVVSSLQGREVILCQIASKNVRDEYAIRLVDTDFAEGSLIQESNIRPNKIFTADEDIILYKLGCLKKEKITVVVDRIVSIIMA